MGGFEPVLAGDDGDSVRLEILLDLVGDGRDAVAGRAGLERADVVEIDVLDLAAGEVAGIGDAGTQSLLAAGRRGPEGVQVRSASA